VSAPLPPPFVSIADQISNLTVELDRLSYDIKNKMLGGGLTPTQLANIKTNLMIIASNLMQTANL